MAQAIYESGADGAWSVNARPSQTRNSQLTKKKNKSKNKNKNK